MVEDQKPLRWDLLVIRDESLTVIEVKDWLQQHENSMRPPVATAKFLVFCVKLHDLGQPFPPRKEVAAHLGVSVPLVDTALSQRASLGHITITLRFVQGNVRRRVSTIRQRIVEPCRELIELVHAAEEREAKAQRAMRRRARPVDAG